MTEVHVEKLKEFPTLYVTAHRPSTTLSRHHMSFPHSTLGCSQPKMVVFLRHWSGGSDLISFLSHQYLVYV